MNFHILTLFPDMVEQGLNTSIIGRAVGKGLLNIETINISIPKTIFLNSSNLYDIKFDILFINSHNSWSLERILFFLKYGNKVFFFVRVYFLLRCKNFFFEKNAAPLPRAHARGYPHATANAVCKDGITSPKGLNPE